MIQADEISTFIMDKLEQTMKVALVVLREDLTIEQHNNGFIEVIQSPHSLVGEPFHSILLPESRQILNKESLQDTMSLRINFKVNGGSAVSMDCHLKKSSGYYIIIGERPLFTDNSIIEKMTVLTNELTMMTRELNRKNIALKNAQQKIKTLHGIIPICMHCKEARDDEGYWSQLDRYIMEHSEAEISHGICPDCLKKHYPEYS